MFIGSYSIATAAGNPNSFTLTDTSDYTNEPENTFTGRTIQLITTTDATLVPAGTTTTYINFPYSAGNSITIDCMERDYALNVVVSWASSNPQTGSIYIAELIYGFESYNANSEYQVIQAITARPSIAQDWNYWLNLGRVQTEISNSVQAVYYQQQVSSQWAMNRAAFILQNKLTNF